MRGHSVTSRNGIRNCMVIGDMKKTTIVGSDLSTIMEVCSQILIGVHLWHSQPLAPLVKKPLPSRGETGGDPSMQHQGFSLSLSLSLALALSLSLALALTVSILWTENGSFEGVMCRLCICRYTRILPQQRKTMRGNTVVFYRSSLKIHRLRLVFYRSSWKKNVRGNTVVFYWSSWIKT